MGKCHITWLFLVDQVNVFSVATLAEHQHRRLFSFVKCLWERLIDLWRTVEHQKLQVWLLRVPTLVTGSPMIVLALWLTIWRHPPSATAGLLAWRQTPKVVGKSFENDTIITFSQGMLLQGFCRMFLWYTCKSFYWQLHWLHATSQYLQSWPFFSKTSVILPGILSINFWTKSWLIAVHSCIISVWNL